MGLELVSIVVPLYNAELYVKEFLDSVKAQTYKNWELIIVDDGSTDGSDIISKQYTQKDSRIKYYLRDNERKKGGNTCRNIGLEKAQGKYIIWFDADDIVAPYALEQRVKFMEQNPDLDFAVFPALGFSDKIGNWNGNLLGYKSEKNALENLINKNLPFAVWTNIYRKISLENKSIDWDENMISLQDSDFNILCLSKDLKFKECNSPADYFWRDTKNSVTKQIVSDSHCSNNIYFFEKLATNPLFSKKYRNDLKLAAIWTYSKLSKNNFGLDKFKKIDYFKNNKFLLYKLNFLNKNFSNLKNQKLLSLLNILFFPFLTGLSRLKQRNLPFLRKKSKDLKDIISITNRILQVQ